MIDAYTGQRISERQVIRDFMKVYVVTVGPKSTVVSWESTRPQYQTYGNRLNEFRAMGRRRVGVRRRGRWFVFDQFEVAAYNRRDVVTRYEC